MFTEMDKSNYLRGLLLLAKKDKRLLEPEKDLIRKAANRLGFSKDFYEDSLRFLMANDHIKESNILFSKSNILEEFIKEGLELACVDNQLLLEETALLRAVALENEMPLEKFELIYNSFMNNHCPAVLEHAS